MGFLQWLSHKNNLQVNSRPYLFWIGSWYFYRRLSIAHSLGPAVIFDGTEELPPFWKTRLSDAAEYVKCTIYYVIKFHLRFFQSSKCTIDSRSHQSMVVISIKIFNFKRHHILFINYWQRNLFIGDASEPRQIYAEWTLISCSGCIFVDEFGDGNEWSIIWRVTNEID